VSEVDPDRLAGFLTDRFGPAGEFRLARIGGGQSNPSFFLDWGAHRFVLRKQPAGPILKGAHAIDREYRVLEALFPTPVPVPRPVLYHDDPALLGTPFYLMERVEGRVFTDTTLADLPSPERRPVWMALAGTLAALHALRPEEIGLADFGRPGSYFDRQLARWDRQYRASPSGPVAEIDRLFDWLTAQRPPEDGRVSLCHGDFRLGNVMFQPEAPRVAAVLDWELSTLGHPLADLGFCCMAWNTAPEEYGGLLGTDLAAMGLPTEAEFVAAYMETARDPAPLLPFHKAFALYRFAVIFVGIADRARAGSAADPEAARLGPLAVRFARRGLEVAEAE
jgi:aminoglycoside phosphotransferase (APT) family kinase protein